MNLFIIGNGFDLGHDLDTRYWDFRTFLEEYHYDFLEDFEEKYGLWGEHLRTTLWSNIEYYLADIQDDVLLEQMYQYTDLGLESGNVGIEDTLNYFFSDKFRYIENLTLHLKDWIVEVNKEVNSKSRKTSLIKENSSDIFINFNYTNTLEEVYKINNRNILHIHGDVNFEDELVLGHSNNDKMDFFRGKYKEFQNKGDERISPIYSTLFRYCDKTYKDVDRYIPKLRSLKYNSIEKIMIIGHSLSDVDLPYFSNIKELVRRDVVWCIYFWGENERDKLKKQLKEIGIADQQIQMIPTSEFYDLNS